MSGIPVNPGQCCGSAGECCDGHAVPERLVATFQSANCGTFTIPLSMTKDDDIKTVWKGSGSIQCKDTPPEWGPSDCIEHDIDLELEIQYQGCEWGVISNSCGGLDQVTMSCPPFSFTLDLNDCGCYQEPAYLIITE